MLAGSAGSCIWSVVSKYQNGTPKVPARKAFNKGKVWNPVCCHSKRTVKIVLWNTFSGNVLQRIKHFRYKLAELSLIVIFEQNLPIIERNEIFDNGKQNFYSHTDYNLFMLQNGLDRKEAIFVIVPL